jgi:hypothetical protein
MVRDVVTRAVVAHFRAHTAPLLLLKWDGSGTLLVTASLHGHNINIFQVGAHSCRALLINTSSRASMLGDFFWSTVLMPILGLGVSSNGALVSPLLL